MKKILFLSISILLFLSTSNSFGQISFTGYSSLCVGVGTSQEKMFSGELKTFVNRNIDDFLFELDGFYNFKGNENYRFSVGLGANFSVNKESLANSLTLPLVLEVIPSQLVNNLSLVFELAPEKYFDTEDLNLRYLWGIRYTFNSHRKK